MSEDDTQRPRSHGFKSIRPKARPEPLLSPDPQRVHAWDARVITLVPQAFPGVLGESLTGRALLNGLWHLDTLDLRSFGEGRHRAVDDTPAGGGAGMVLRPDVMGRAIDAAMSGTAPGWPLVYLSPRGARFDQAMARDLAQGPGVTLVCGRFEGLDQRVIDHYGATEISLGDFVMTGGEIAAQALIDACVRLLPGVLGNAASTEEESFGDGLLEHPHYTRPAEWRGHGIPPVLLSGNHAGIARWRQARSRALTRLRRPDLWARRDGLPDAADEG